MSDIEISLDLNLKMTFKRVNVESSEDASVLGEKLYFPTAKRYASNRFIKVRYLFSLKNVFYLPKIDILHKNYTKKIFFRK